MKTPHSKTRARLNRAAGEMLVALVLFFTCDARSDSALLRGGEKLIGRVVSEEPAKVIFESQTLGGLEIARDRIERLERDTPATASAPVSTNQATAFGATIIPSTNVF